jgi:hypothetical protein
MQELRAGCCGQRHIRLMQQSFLTKIASKVFLALSEELVRHAGAS